MLGNPFKSSTLPLGNSNLNLSNISSVSNMNQSMCSTPTNNSKQRMSLKPRQSFMISTNISTNNKENTTHQQQTTTTFDK